MHVQPDLLKYEFGLSLAPVTKETQRNTTYFFALFFNFVLQQAKNIYFFANYNYNSLELQRKVLCVC